MAARVQVSETSVAPARAQRVVPIDQDVIGAVVLGAGIDLGQLEGPPADLGLHAAYPVAGRCPARGHLDEPGDVRGDQPQQHDLPADLALPLDPRTLRRTLHDASPSNTRNATGAGE